MVLSRARPAATEMVPLSDSLGRTLSGPIVAAEDIPPFPSSAMDGFAVRSQDVARDPSGSLRITGHIAAGMGEEHFVGPGCAVSIMTGAVFPEGADAVIPVERSRLLERGLVKFDIVPQPGRHVRPAAEDVQRGSEVFHGGEHITPAMLGMLATLGVDPVPVSVAPRVRVISTGDEIVDPALRPGPGQIRNSNGPALRTQVQVAGGRCPGFEHVPDDPKAIRKGIEAGDDADILVFSGGVSMGDHDHVRNVLESMGGKMLFWQVRQRPGKPLAFAELGHQLVIGLPGNPVSSAMCFEMYVHPLIERMLGRSELASRRLVGTLNRAMDKVENLHYFARGTAWIDEQGALRAEDSGPQGSNLYGSVVRANCIIHLPVGTSRVEAGSPVEIQMLPWARMGSTPPVD